MGIEIYILGWKHIAMAKRCHKYFFFENLWLSTFAKPILKNVFINYTQNMVVQLPNNVIVKRIFFIDIND